MTTARHYHYNNIYYTDLKYCSDILTFFYNWTADFLFLDIFLNFFSVHFVCGEQ